MAFDCNPFKVFNKYITFELFNAVGFTLNLIRDYVSMLTGFVLIFTVFYFTLASIHTVVFNI